MHVEAFKHPSLRSVRLLVLTALIVGIHVPPSRADDRADIREIMMGIFDKPDARLVVEPIVAADHFAVASWTQGDRGGRALLRLESGKWRIVLCRGDPLKSASMLAQAGVPPASAAQLASLLKESESHVPPERATLFSTFQGVVHVEDDHGHDDSEHKHHEHRH